MSPSRSALVVGSWFGSLVLAISLPFLTRERRRFLPGGSTPRLEEHLADTATLDPAVMEDSRVRFRTVAPR